MVGGGECSVVVKTQSAKICVNFNLGGGGGGQLLCSSQNSKCQDLHKFHFSGRGGSGPNPRTVCSCQFKQKFCLATFWKPLHRRLTEITWNFI